MIVRRYLHTLLRLIPPGLAWRAQHATMIRAALAAIADELERVDARAAALMRELDPRQTAELLLEWERELGLPDCCTPASQTQAERRAAVIQKLLTEGGQSATFYIALARVLGYEARVIEYRPFQAGRSVAGDAITNGPWVFRWLLAVSDAVPVRPFKAGQGAAGDPLRTWGNERLECVITAARPAHTVVGFAYGT